MMKYSLFFPLVLPAIAAPAEYNPDAELLLHTLGISFPTPAGPGRRSLRHTVPPMVTPDGCSYSYKHDWVNKLLTDKIFCPNWCGQGVSFTLSVNTLLDDDFEPNVTYADCIIPQCNACANGFQIHGCPCPLLTSFDQVCAAICVDTGVPNEGHLLDHTDDGEGALGNPGSDTPSMVPSDVPSIMPSDVPSLVPSDMPSIIPSDVPSNMPSFSPNTAG